MKNTILIIVITFSLLVMLCVVCPVARCLGHHRWPLPRQSLQLQLKRSHSSNDKTSRPKTGVRKLRNADPWAALFDKQYLVQSKAKMHSARTTDTAAPKMINCSVYGTCSGCSRIKDLEESKSVQAAKQIFSDWKIPFPIKLGRTEQWRTHAKLAVQPTHLTSYKSGVKIGLYKAGSHEVVRIPDCAVHHPSINRAVAVLEDACSQEGIVGYVSGSKARPAFGQLRYIQLSVNRRTSKVQLTLVWNCETYKDCSPSIGRLTRRLYSLDSGLWEGIYINLNTKDSNAIFSYEPDNWIFLRGEEFMKEKIGAVPVLLSPQSFRQANLDAFEQFILPEVCRHVRGDEAVAELYAGVGAIGLNALIQCGASQLICTEMNPFGAQAFQKSLALLNNESISQRAVYLPLSAKASVGLDSVREADVLIVDPPRKGLDNEVLQMLCSSTASTSDISSTSASSSSSRSSRYGNGISQSAIKRIIYVSCSVPALERDLTLLLSHHWRIASAMGCLLFPGSDHIESVVVLERTNR